MKVCVVLPAFPAYGTSIPRVWSYLSFEGEMRNWGALILILPATMYDRSAYPFSGSIPQYRYWHLGVKSNLLHWVFWVILWPPSLGINLILFLRGKLRTLVSLPRYGQIRLCVRVCMCTWKKSRDRQQTCLQLSALIYKNPGPEF